MTTSENTPPARWIGFDPSDLAAYAGERGRLADYAAVSMADAILDGADDWAVEYETRYYARNRAEHRRVDALYNRLYAGSPDGWRFAGALVRDGDR